MSEVTPVVVVESKPTGRYKRRPLSLIRSKNPKLRAKGMKALAKRKNFKGISKKTQAAIKDFMAKKKVSKRKGRRRGGPRLNRGITANSTLGKTIGAAVATGLASTERAKETAALIKEMEEARDAFYKAYKAAAKGNISTEQTDLLLQRIEMGMSLNMTAKELIGAFPPAVKKAFVTLGNWGTTTAQYDTLAALLQTYGESKTKVALLKGFPISRQGFASITAKPVVTVGNPYQPSEGWIKEQISLNNAANDPAYDTYNGALRQALASSSETRIATAGLEAVEEKK